MNLKKSIFTLALVALMAGGAAAKTSLVNSIKVNTKNEDKGECQLTIRGNQDITRHKEILVGPPPKMVIDISGAVNRLRSKIDVESNIIKRIRTSQFSMQPQKVRIVLDLKEEVQYEIQEDQALTIILRTKMASAMAREESLKTEQVRAESTRMADSVQQARVADSLEQARAGIITRLKERGLLVPVAGGGGGGLVVLLGLFIFLRIRKRRKEQEEFERLMLQDPGRRPPAGGIPTGETKDQMAAELDEIKEELDAVKEQAAQIGGETGPGLAEGAEPKEDAPVLDLDEFQKKFAGADTAGVSKDLDAQIREIEAGQPQAPQDEFDLDATIEELKKKISESQPTETEPAPAEPTVAAAETAGPAEPPAEQSPVEPARPPEARFEETEAEAIPAPGPGQEPEAVSGAEKGSQTLEQAEKEETELLNRMQVYQEKIAQYKALVAAREQRLAELVDLNSRINADMQEIQGRLDRSLKSLGQLQQAARVEEPRQAQKIDVVIDDSQAPAPVIQASEAMPEANPEPASPPAEEEPKFKKVFKLADQGMDVGQIAQQLGIGKGQVELFLKLREKGKMG